MKLGIAGVISEIIMLIINLFVFKKPLSVTQYFTAPEGDVQSEKPCTVQWYKVNRSHHVI